MGKSTARGDIEQYILGGKRISENWAIGHLKFVMKFSSVTKDFLLQKIFEIETHPSYASLRTSESMIKLKI